MLQRVITRRRQGGWQRYIPPPWWQGTGRNPAWHMCFCTMWIGRLRGNMQMSFCVKSIVNIPLDGYGILKYRRRTMSPAATMVVGFARFIVGRWVFLVIYLSLLMYYCLPCYYTVYFHFGNKNLCFIIQYLFKKFTITDACTPMMETRTPI